MDLHGKWWWISILETQNSTGGFTPANVNQIVSDVSIEFKISVKPYGHAGFPMASALGYLPAELYKQDPNTGNDVPVDLENMYLFTDQLVVAFGVGRADLLRASAHGSGPGTGLAAGCACGISRRLAEYR
jgi:hypothetical protein